MSLAVLSAKAETSDNPRLAFISLLRRSDQITSKSNFGSSSDGLPEV